MLKLVKRSDKYKSLSRELNRKNAIANKRFKRLQNKEFQSPALTYVKNTGGKFRNSSKYSYNEMLKANKRVDNFLNMDSSTSRGTRKVVNNWINSTGMSKVANTNDLTKNAKLMDKFFQVYQKVQEFNELSARVRSYQATFNDITNYFEKHGTQGTVEDILADVLDEQSESYQNENVENNPFNFLL